MNSGPSNSQIQADVTEIIADETDLQSGYKVQMVWKGFNPQDTLTVELIKPMIQTAVKHYFVSDEIAKKAVEDLNIDKKADFFVKAAISLPKIEPVMQVSNKIQQNLSPQIIRTVDSQTTALKQKKKVSFQDFKSKSLNLPSVEKLIVIDPKIKKNVSDLIDGKDPLLGNVLKKNNSLDSILKNKVKTFEKTSAEQNIAPGKIIMNPMVLPKIEEISIEQGVNTCSFKNKMVVSINWKINDANSELSSDYTLNLNGKIVQETESDREITQESVAECIKQVTKKIILKESFLEEIVNDIKKGDYFMRGVIQTKPIEVQSNESKPNIVLSNSSVRKLRI